MKRHLCTMCRRKRKEKFMFKVIKSDKANSYIWRCHFCIDGRTDHDIQSFLQDGQSKRSLRLSNQDHEKFNVNCIKSFRDLQLSNVQGKFILDVCCGHRKMWFNKNHPNVIYQDIKSDVAKVIGDFTNLNYPDKSFKLVVFDPPHLKDRENTPNWIKEQYGTLKPEEWTKDINKGLSECLRVLDDFGILIFKWSEINISLGSILSICPIWPLFGHTTTKGNKTHWFCFMKLPTTANDGRN